jgi:hypothetical protein
MKYPVSLEYLIVMALLAVSAAILSFVTPQPVFNLAALLLGIYALHLVSVRVVVREYAGFAPTGRQRRKRATGEEAEIKQLREELDLERRELDNRKVELQERIAAAEQQWELLRQMIRDRVEGGGAMPDSVVAGASGVLTSTPTSTPGRSNGPDEPPRIHGRW